MSVARTRRASLAPGEQPSPVVRAPLPDHLVDALDRAFRRLRRTMIKPPAGMVPVPALGRQLEFPKIAACDAIAELAGRSGSVAVKDVATALGLEHSTVSRLLSEIEEDGLLVRSADPDDRRRTIVTLTELGEAVVSDATTMTRFFTRTLLTDWPEHDVEQLTRLLGRLADTVQERLADLPQLALDELRRAHGLPPESLTDLACGTGD